MARSELGFVAPPALAIAEGATTPDPGIAGVSVWSSTLGRPVHWTGALWTAGTGTTTGMTIALACGFANP